MKSVVGLLLGLLIGITCRYFDVPAPSPPKLIGALLVVSMTVGYMTADKLITARSKEKSAAAVGRTYRANTPDER